jgi:hypothetical protein
LQINSACLVHRRKTLSPESVEPILLDREDASG